jgi:glycosyltransferase involved in cell wall biosynthesis
MSQWPMVSIVVPVYNGGRTIEALLRSLTALEYPEERYEIIVVDNNSIDDTPRRVEKYPARLLCERRVQSSYAARNTGVRAARGEIIAFIDADCTASPGWLKQLLHDHTDGRWGGFAGRLVPDTPRGSVARYLALVGYLSYASLRQPFFGPETVGERLFSRLPATDFRRKLCVPPDLVNPPTANVAYRRGVFETVGLFDHRMTSCGDLDLAWRVQTRTGWAIQTVPAALVYHQHRQTLAGLIRLYRRVGWGYGSLALKYSSDPGHVARWMALENGALLALAIPKYVYLFFARLLLRPFRQRDALYLRWPIYALAACLSYYSGRISGVRSGGSNS